MPKDKFPGIKDPPKTVHFKYPEGGETKATVVKEVKKKKKGSVSGEYCFVIQLIEQPDGENRIRFGYYRRKDGTKKFRWGSQTTFDTTVSFTKELIKMAELEGIL
jgi:hypothetical protein